MTGSDKWDGIQGSGQQRYISIIMESTSDQRSTRGLGGQSPFRFTIAIVGTPAWEAHIAVSAPHPCQVVLLEV